MYIYKFVLSLGTSEYYLKLFWNIILENRVSYLSTTKEVILCVLILIALI